MMRRFFLSSLPHTARAKWKCLWCIIFAWVLLTGVVGLLLFEGDIPEGLSTQPMTLGPQRDSISLSREEGLQRFTIVLLVYKAPRSTANTLRSLATSGLVYYPRFHEVLIYKQMLDPTRVAAEEKQFADLVWNGSSNTASTNRRLRVIGSEKNVPVPEAMAAAVRAVETEYVLYVECDRPVYTFPFGVGGAAAVGVRATSTTEEAVRSYVASILSVALQYLDENRAHVFRLQLYASPLIRNASLPLRPPPPPPPFPFTAGPRARKQLTAEGLPLEMYGTTPYEYCHFSPRLNDPSGFCMQSAKYRARYGSTFNMAYCGHWRRFIDGEHRHSSLCDALCAKEWITAVKGDQRVSEEIKVSPLWQFFEDARRTADADDSVSGLVTGNNNPTRAEPFILRLHGVDASNTSTPHGFAHNILCFPSSLCNWTNQPALYRRSWFLKFVAARCLAGKRLCVGLPGRGSAALLERFVTELRPWRHSAVRICLTDGLFIHNEIDN